MLDNLKELIPFFPIKITWEALLIKLLIVILISGITALFIYLINKFIKDIRGKDILKLNENTSWYKWVIGAICTTILLYGFQIISFKIQAIVLVAFVWDKFFEKMYTTAQSDSLLTQKDKKKLEEISPADLQQIS